MNDIHNHFVVTRIDKANGNVVFACQQFHILVLIKELGLGHNSTNTNKTYIPVLKTNKQVISDRTTFLRNKFNLVGDEEIKKLPNIYWMPKLHKRPSKASFVIVPPQSSVYLLYVYIYNKSKPIYIRQSSGAVLINIPEQKKK